jgi:hypothetical protein
MGYSCKYVRSYLAAPVALAVVAAGLAVVPAAGAVVVGEAGAEAGADAGGTVALPALPESDLPTQVVSATRAA